MEWNWCAARGPAAITHPIHFINKEKSNKFNFSSLIHELFGLFSLPQLFSSLAFVSFLQQKQKREPTKTFHSVKLVCCCFLFFAERCGGPTATNPLKERATQLHFIPLPLRRQCSSSLLFSSPRPFSKSEDGKKKERRVSGAMFDCSSSAASAPSKHSLISSINFMFFLGSAAYRLTNRTYLLL